MDLRQMILKRIELVQSLIEGLEVLNPGMKRLIHAYRSEKLALERIIEEHDEVTQKEIVYAPI